MDSPWHYILIPQNKIPKVRPGGWGSIPVIVTIGKTTWKTSLFPMKSGQYFFTHKKTGLKTGKFKSRRHCTNNLRFQSPVKI